MKFKKGDYILAKEVIGDCTTWQLGFILDYHFLKNPIGGEYEVDVIFDSSGIYEKRDNWLGTVVDDVAIKVESEHVALFRMLFE